MPISDEVTQYFDKRRAMRGPDDCWLWTGPMQNAGYGVACCEGRIIQATHLALELDGRPRPFGLLALHSCDNPPCVNPAHLRWGTVRENAADMVARGRAVSRERHWTNLHPGRVARGDNHGSHLKPETILRGSANGYAKLNEASVALIKQDRRAGTEVAKAFGVSPSTISLIRLGKRWVHV